MDKYISFNGGNAGHLKGSNDKAYYSEEESSKTKKDEQTASTQKIFIQKQSKFSQNNKPSKDSDSEEEKKNDTEQNSSKDKTDSRFILQKGSISAQQHLGDNDETEMEEVADEMSKLDLDERRVQELSNKPKKDVKQRFLEKEKKEQGQGKKQMQSDNEGNRQNPQDFIKNNPWRHLIFGPTVSEANFKKHLTLTYRGLVYAKKCLKGPSDKFIKTKQVLVPDCRNSKGRTLLLDLDETLIHSCGLKDNPDYIVVARGEYGDENKIGIRIRPYCQEFLSKMSKLWDIYIFTASSPSYASAIVNFLDPEAKYILGILNRTNCMETKNGFFIKDLRILKNKNLKTMVLVDNLAHSFGFQIENGIPILEWHQDKSDQELKYLVNYLVEAAQAEDVRVFNKEKLKLMELADSKMDDL